MTTIEHMTQAEARHLAVQLLWENGLYDWKVSFGSAHGRAGSCNFPKREIRLSLFLMAVRTREGTLDTIRHEVAHAIAGAGAGHGQEWKDVHVRLGGTGQVEWDPKSLAPDANIYRWTYSCAGCHRHLGKSVNRRNFTNRVTRCCERRLVATRMGLTSLSA